jgi:hypothetical protein
MISTPDSSMHQPKVNLSICFVSSLLPGPGHHGIKGNNKVANIAATEKGNKYAISLTEKQRKELIAGPGSRCDQGNNKVANIAATEKGTKYEPTSRCLRAFVSGHLNALALIHSQPALFGFGLSVARGILFGNPQANASHPTCLIWI